MILFSTKLLYVVFFDTFILGKSMDLFDNKTNTQMPRDIASYKVEVRHNTATNIQYFVSYDWLTIVLSHLIFPFHHNIARFLRGIACHSHG